VGLIPIFSCSPSPGLDHLQQPVEKLETSEAWRAFTGAGTVGMSIESAFTYSSYTWLHVLSRSTNGETIGEMPTKWPRLPRRSIPMKV
jgi:hypothetical protein